jgi:Protein of unknown function (DUF669)
MSDQKKIPVTPEDLASYEDVYGESDVTEEDYETVPDGKYQVIVERVELTRTLKGDPILKWELRILGPKHEGRRLWRNNVLGGPENIRWLKKDLYSCDLRLPRLSELPANLDRLLDIQLEVTKRTKGDYSSVYINRRVKAGAPNPSDTRARPEAKASANANANKRSDALGRF